MEFCAYKEGGVWSCVADCCDSWHGRLWSAPLDTVQHLHRVRVWNWGMNMGCHHLFGFGFGFFSVFFFFFFCSYVVGAAQLRTWERSRLERLASTGRWMGGWPASPRDGRIEGSLASNGTTMTMELRDATRQEWSRCCCRWAWEEQVECDSESKSSAQRLARRNRSQGTHLAPSAQPTCNMQLPPRCLYLRPIPCPRFLHDISASAINCRYVEVCFYLTLWDDIVNIANLSADLICGC